MFIVALLIELPFRVTCDLSDAWRRLENFWFEKPAEIAYDFDLYLLPELSKTNKSLEIPSNLNDAVTS